MAKHIALSTQERNPRSAANRSFFQAVIVLFPVANAGLLILQEELQKSGLVLPGWAWAVLNVLVVVTSLLIRVATRIMAVPGVNDKLRRYMPVLAPEDNHVELERSRAAAADSEYPAEDPRRGQQAQEE